MDEGLILLTKTGGGLYHPSFMSNPILIDPVAFAREGRTRTGKIAVAELDPRVHDSLADTSGEAEFVLVGSVDRLRRPHLTLTVNATLNVPCQRCLEAMTETLSTRADIVLFFDQEKLEAAATEDEELDAILAEPEMDVIALIEDEIIMGLPFAPKHEVCGTEALERAKNDKPNPFAVLAKLKKSASE